MIQIRCADFPCMFVKKLRLLSPAAAAADECRLQKVSSLTRSSVCLVSGFTGRGLKRDLTTTIFFSVLCTLRLFVYTTDGYIQLLLLLTLQTY